MVIILMGRYLELDFIVKVNLDETKKQVYLLIETQELC